MKSTNQHTKVEKGQQFPLTIKRLGINGEGVGYFKRHVVFVKGALPGEEVVATVTKPGDRFSDATIKKIRKASPDRISAPCPIYDQCGGCQLQHMQYEATLKEKADLVRQAFERYTSFSERELPIQKTLGMENPWYYRNKSQLQVNKSKGQLKAGLYAENSHTLIDLSACMVQHKLSNHVTQVMKEILQDLNISIYNERKHRGAIRTIVTRVSFTSEDVQLVLVTAEPSLPKRKQLIEQVKKRLPEVTSFMHNVNEQKTSIIFGNKTELVSGEETIEETLGDVSFSLSARAFFQLNPEQTVVLYNEAKKAAKLTGTEKVVDAYCGVGTIGLWLADQAGDIRGMDVIEESILNARENAAKHGVTSYQYEVGKAEDWFPKWSKQGWKPDVVVLDPPRTGCDQKLLHTLKQTKPHRIVYVSCNPSTLAKDVEQLKQSGYKVQNIQPVDMFPWTAQVESVTELVYHKS
ncbi:23S rRNA (uracil(1939)-C(5))-methyltransferase RlmD [Alkalicoccobacillus porphyridii]|uniref:23S rRNA (Uracil(1939)-C(5))-methyltransferase RlmD n=1 Tax=Alkalicoccobacillus porphyridii TaxID=2597270 RepID=A0A553ZV69_9BACI|nr:23S rRNA (uracil(1939)-C(5))-methyltransferase RlmD [Alkalicoccobacillus porphyridii]TSB45206.1 23S rRNA (uracil(1939)-C(5))-methyltransferase RlmD [Alkalicoccobacillus porphyridii]